MNEIFFVVVSNSLLGLNYIPIRASPTNSEEVYPIYVGRTKLCITEPRQTDFWCVFSLDGKQCKAKPISPFTLTPVSRIN